MAFHKRKKLVRMRGTRTHGWGRLHRGSGNKGGAGNAGSGKKADAKKPSFWDRKFGKHGFIAHNSCVDHCIINVGDLAQHLDNWVAAKQATHAGGVYTVDLGKIGYTKLLSTGKASKKVNVTVAAASARAVEKVKAAGGSVTASA
ncbi:uL15 family ribosomal protein [Candidatus Woesearchaeota archaeon]|nr:uL15 family ribosomal protein [Candidatus Woesearchaeota archaeon]